MTKPNDYADYEFKAVTLQTKERPEYRTEKEWAELNGRKYQIRMTDNTDKDYIALEDTSVEIVLSHKLFDKLELV